MQDNPPEPNNSQGQPEPIQQGIFSQNTDQTSSTEPRNQGFFSQDPNQPEQYDDGQYYDDQYDPNQPYDDGQYYDDGQASYDPNRPEQYDDGQYYDDQYDPNQPYNDDQYYDDGQYDNRPYNPSHPGPRNQNPTQSTNIIDQISEMDVDEVKEKIKNMSKGSKIALIVVSACLLVGIIIYIVFKSTVIKPLNAAQDDTQRRNDYSALSAKIINYMTNNNGSLPPNGALNSSIFSAKDPSGDPYVVTVIECPSDNICPGKPSLTKGQVYVVKKAKCKDGSLTNIESSRGFAIYGYQNGSDGIYCLSSS